MPGEISRSYDGPKDGSPLFPEWICPRCERDKSKCICRASEAMELTATDSQHTQPAIVAQAADAWFAVNGSVTVRQAFMAGVSWAQQQQAGA